MCASLRSDGGGSTASHSAATARAWWTPGSAARTDTRAGPGISYRSFCGLFASCRSKGQPRQEATLRTPHRRTLLGPSGARDRSHAGGRCPLGSWIRAFEVKRGGAEGVLAAEPGAGFDVGTFPDPIPLLALAGAWRLGGRGAKARGGRGRAASATEPGSAVTGGCGGLAPGPREQGLDPRVRGDDDKEAGMTTMRPGWRRRRMLVSRKLGAGGREGCPYRRNRRRIGAGRDGGRGQGARRWACGSIRSGSG